MAARSPALQLPPLPVDSVPGTVHVGYSGGLDSTVLLHLLCTAPEWRGHVQALHVHHGLHADAGAWAVHCRRICDALGVPLRVAEVQVPRDKGEGLEAAARHARHAAYAGAMTAGDVLALAHHRDDQAETFLLRALRASGVDGLGAMRPWRAFGAGWLWRPLLDVPRERLLAHAREYDLAWIEDPANDDTDHDRNFLRRQVLPLLRERWPECTGSLSRSAALCAGAAELLSAEDAVALADACSKQPGTLAIAALEVLPAPRRARVLRRWVEQCGLPPLPARGIAAIETDLLGASPDAEAAFAWHDAVIQAWRGQLHARRRTRPLPEGWRTHWDGASTLELPGGGRLRLQGADPFAAPVIVHARAGGERIRLPGRSHGHALKHVLQDLGVPPWIRARLPLLSDAEGRLLAAGDLAYSAAFDAWLRASDALLLWEP